MVALSALRRVQPFRWRPLSPNTASCSFIPVPQTSATWRQASALMTVTQHGGTSSRAPMAANGIQKQACGLHPTESPRITRVPARRHRRAHKTSSPRDLHYADATARPLGVRARPVPAMASPHPLPPPGTLSQAPTRVDRFATWAMAAVRHREGAAAGERIRNGRIVKGGYTFRRRTRVGGRIGDPARLAALKMNTSSE